MQFVIHAYDKPDSLNIRLENRPAHVAYVTGPGSGLMVAGPMLAEDGETPIGTMLVVEAESKAAATAFAEGDPYAKAGLFAEVRIDNIKITVNNATPA